ncbi:MAG: nucleoside triphosphate pyrophosphohydrolase [candidate division Zixibacteria bacterium RBG_16_53_22]|nr:MAG: nucleoside triphosphate pyrophosphohydrolase [candidate division Zixibacteria bacterium RBG_16_53_22]
MNNFKRLVEIIDILRGPNGCPWDKKQDHKSLKPYIIEEAYEVIEAIEAGDDSRLSEELGDLLTQIVMHAQLARERGAFDIDTVAEKIADKLVERHPHVFSSRADLTPEEVLHNWERIKLEKSRDPGYSVLQGVPLSLPALLKAFRIQEKVGRYGFDWKNPGDVIAKVKEEIAEFEEALQTGEKLKQEHELGDLLFSLVNLGRHLGMQPEEALNGTIRRFTRRFQYIEQRLRETGKTLTDSNLEEMDKYWDEAKSILP